MSYLNSILADEHASDDNNDSGEAMTAREGEELWRVVGQREATRAWTMRTDHRAPESFELHALQSSSKNEGLGAASHSRAAWLWV